MTEELCAYCNEPLPHFETRANSCLKKLSHMIKDKVSEYKTFYPKPSSIFDHDKTEHIIFGRLGNRPECCLDPNNVNHVCYKDCWP